MISGPIDYIRRSLARQLVAGAVIVQVALISLFMVDLVQREATTLQNGRLTRAEGVARMLATSSVSWTLADDLQGLDELTRSATAFEDVRYAIILNPDGRVLAHSDHGLAGQYIADPVGRSLISSEPVVKVLSRAHDALDVAAPITSNADGRLIGWAWVSLSREDVAGAIRLAVLKGVFYVLFVTITATGITWLIARNFTRALGNLAEVARRFQAGDRNVRTRQGRPDEIGDVARGLDEMLDAVSASEQAILRREDALAQVQRVARLGGFQRLFAKPTAEWSKETYAIFGHDPDLPPLQPDELIARVHPDDRERVQSALADPGQDVQNMQFTVLPPGEAPRICWAEVRLIRANGVPIGYRGICQDVTERENSTAQLRQAQKMELVGQLTGGLAHDFNNLLSVIVGNLEFVEDALPDRAPALEFSRSAMSAALKGGELIQRLLAFSRRQPLAPQVFDVTQLLENMVLMLGRMIGPQIDIRFVPQPGPWLAVADSAQVESAVLNLVLNARDAMPGGGCLLIEISGFCSDTDVVVPMPTLASGAYVVISVTDTGAGIPAELLSQVFEPFFTTKSVGKGSGLGLSMIYGFASQSGGAVTISSELERGTAIRLYLPAMNEPAAEVDRTPERIPAARPHETVLIVEDDEVLRRITVRNITSLGYPVLEAANAVEALSLLKLHPEIDLLFTDLAMPGAMNGYELAERARKGNPEIKILYTSGFPDPSHPAADQPGAGVPLLNKPYRKPALEKSLRQALEKT